MSVTDLIPTGHVLALFTMFALGAFAGFVAGAVTWAWANARPSLAARRMNAGYQWLIDHPAETRYYREFGDSDYVEVTRR